MAPRKSPLPWRIMVGIGLGGSIIEDANGECIVPISPVGPLLDTSDASRIVEAANSNILTAERNVNTMSNYRVSVRIVEAPDFPFAHTKESVRLGDFDTYEEGNKFMEAIMEFVKNFHQSHPFTGQEGTARKDGVNEKPTTPPPPVGEGGRARAFDNFEVMETTRIPIDDWPGSALGEPKPEPTPTGPSFPLGWRSEILKVLAKDGTMSPSTLASKALHFPLPCTNIYPILSEMARDGLIEWDQYGGKLVEEKRPPTPDCASVYVAIDSFVDAASLDSRIRPLDVLKTLDVIKDYIEDKHRKCVLKLVKP